jgi:O-antigen/teichoic acid export membrane protein
MQTSSDGTGLEAQAPAAGAEEARAQVRGSAWLLIGQMVGIAINLSAQVLVVRYLTKESFGAFAFALSIIAVGEVLATFGLRRGISRFVPIYMEHGQLGAAAGLLAFATAAVAGLGLLIAVVLMLLRGPISAEVGGEHAAVVLAVLVFMIPVSALENLFDAIFAVFRHARLIALRSYVYIPLARMLVVLGLIATGSGVVVLAAGWVVAGALGVAVYAWMLRATLVRNDLLHREPRQRKLRYPVRELVRFSGPIFTQDLASVLTFAAPTLILGAVGGARDVGAVRTVIPVALTMFNVRSNFALLFVPMASRLYAQRDPQGLHRLYWRSALWMTMFVLPVLLLAVPFGESLTVFLFGERYASSAPVLALLVGGIFVSIALGPNLDVLAVYHRVKFIAWSNVASIVLVLALSGVLVGFGAGPVGAAVASGGALALMAFWWQAGVARFTDVGSIAGGLFRIVVLSVLACGGLTLVRIAVDPPFAVAIVCVMLTWSVIFVSVRESLAVDETVPEFGRLPVLRQLLKARIGPRQASMMGRGSLMVAAIAVVGAIAAAVALGAGGDGNPQPPASSSPSPSSGPVATPAAVRCDRVAAPTGSDSAAGTLRSPYKTPARLARTLRPGETGCLRAGSYDISPDLTFRRAGTATERITLRNYPGEKATLTGGTVVIWPGASFVTVSGLTIDGSRHDDVTVWVMADDAVISDNRITNRTTGLSCIFLGTGSGRRPPTLRTQIRRNRIFDCGNDAHDNHDHGIYAAQTTDAVITDNLIAGSDGWAVQLYPRATHASLLRNTFVSNGGGVIFGGDRRGTSSGNVVERNVISDARSEQLVQSFWEGPQGTGNVARRNCFGRAPDGIANGNGFEMAQNISANPRYRSPSAGDYRIGAGSGCLAVIGSPPAPGAPATVARSGA